MIPAVDKGVSGLWDAATEEGRKEIKGDLWNLNRYISSVQTSNKSIQEHYLMTVNEYYNKNWNDINQHPKLQWQTLCATSHPNKQKHFHEWIPLKKEKNKKEEFLLNLFPDMKRSDVETLAAISTDKEIKQYCERLGWDKKEINAIKL
jgi:desulfoferrodoxin (superoxide reductase-like protein)